MYKAGKLLLVVVALGFVGLLCAGCSVPTHSRTVESVYGPDGRLQRTVVTEHVTQADPNSRPLMPVLKSQDYTK
jgi:hypothetical protein